jgi:hypothetical protein
MRRTNMIWYIIAALCWLLIAGALSERMFTTNMVRVIALVVIAAAWPVTMPAFGLLMLWANRRREITFPPPFADALTVEGLEKLKKALEEAE